MSEKKKCLNCERDVNVNMSICPYCGKSHFIESDSNQNVTDKSDTVKEYIETPMDSPDGVYHLNGVEYVVDKEHKNNNTVQVNILGVNVNNLLKNDSLKKNKKNGLIISLVAFVIFTLVSLGTVLTFNRTVNKVMEVSESKSNASNVNTNNDENEQGSNNIVENNTVEDTANKVVDGQAEEVSYTKGTVSDTEYDNPWLRLKFPIPEGYFNVDSKYYDAYTNANTDCGAYFINATGDKILISIKKNIAENITEEIYLKQLQSKLLQNTKYKYSFLESGMSGIGDKDYYHIDFNVVINGRNYLQSYYFIKKDDKIISFVFTSLDKEPMQHTAMFFEQKSY